MAAANIDREIYCSQVDGSPIKRTPLFSIILVQREPGDHLSSVSTLSSVQRDVVAGVNDRLSLSPEHLSQISQRIERKVQNSPYVGD